MRSKSPIVIAGVLEALVTLGGCSPAPREPAVQSVSVGSEPVVPEPGSSLLPSTRPAIPDASSPEAGNAGVIEPELPMPPAPPKQQVSGSAAIVWVPDDKARLGIRSVYVTESGGQAKVTAQRKEPVLVGTKELWVMKTKKLASKNCNECELCDTEPPTCRKNELKDLTEPYLQSLGSKRKLEPWSGSFSARDGCAQRIAEHDVEVGLIGGVGNVYFASVHFWEQYCGGAHPLFGDETIVFDIDTGKAVSLTVPEPPKPALIRRAKIELGDGCVMDPAEEPEPYSALAEYGEDGGLLGVYGFTKAAPYMCGNGPGHYSVLSEQRSDWLPQALEPYGQLPAWVASYVKREGAKFAFMLPGKRAATARRDFGR